MGSVLKVNDVNLDKILYLPVRGSEKKYIPIEYEKPGNKLVFQTPFLICNTPPIKCEGYYELEVPLFGKSSRKVDRFVRLLKQLDLKFINDAKKNSKSWFIGKSNIRYKSIIREVTNTNRVFENGVIKVKILYGIDGTTILQNGKESSVDELQVDGQIRMLLELYALWTTDEGFGLYMRPLIIDQQVIKKYTFSFIDDNDSDSDILDTEVGPIEDDNEEEKQNVFIKDSDSSIMPIDNKNLKKDIESLQVGSNVSVSSDKLNSEEDILGDISDTMDESEFDALLMTSDFNNVKNIKK